MVNHFDVFLMELIDGVGFPSMSTSVRYWL